ncbi:MAG: protein translocase subunit SecD [SAR324 cluster bacterium]|nr:protein translocase subunit SecD [SAR324 cluster bacterium]
MEIKLKGILILMVLSAALFYAWPTWEAYKPGGDPLKVEHKVNLGLDLQGGMYLDIEVKVDEAVTEIVRRTTQELEELMLDNQVDYIHIAQEGNDIVLELAEAEKIDLEADPYDRFLVLFDKTEKNGQIRISMKSSEAERIRKGSVDQALEVLRNRIDGLGVSEPSLQRQGENSILIQLPGLKDRQRAIELIGPQAILEFRLVNDNATRGTASANEEVKYEEVWNRQLQKLERKIPFVVEKKALLTGEVIRDAQVRFDSQNNEPYVALSFDATGAERFAKITEKNKGRRLAIILDDKVQSAPVIREAITGGEASISGQFTLENASDLAVVLRSGSLPAPIEIREERTVGASLGEDSIRQGLTSLLFGGVLVLVFMIVYYKVAGLFADIALGMNILLIVSILAAFDATLTLPGMAGIVLTVGMSVDANVLIFQRIREELKSSSKPRTAIKEGFGKAFSTIFDSNITTLFAALALLQFGTGPIKGFAVTLSIGILSSMFTAIVVTRFLFDVVYMNRKQLNSISI